MPEGPEIKRAADKLHHSLTGKTITGVYFAFDHLKEFEDKLQAAKIIRVVSRSKAILSQFDNGLSIYSHNQLYGRWEIHPSGEYPQSSRSLRLAIHTKKLMALLYSASDIDVIKTTELAQHPYLEKLGPELLSCNIDELISRFHDTCFHRRQLISLLQDQHFISGMGHYLCCEVLHINQLHPDSRLGDLNKRQREQLARSCQKLTLQSYKTAGITNQIKRAKELKKQGLSFEDYRFYVYRREGLPCYHCGSLVIKEKHGGKMSYLCPECQPPHGIRL